MPIYGSTFILYYGRLPRSERRRLRLREVAAVAQALPLLLPALERRLAVGIAAGRAGTGERGWVGDGDGLRCQAFGMRLRRGGLPQQAVPLHQSARLIFAETGNRRGEALALNGLGLALAAAGKPEAPLRQFEQARTLLQQLGDSEREGRCSSTSPSPSVRSGRARKPQNCSAPPRQNSAPTPTPTSSQHLHQ